MQASIMSLNHTRIVSNHLEYIVLYSFASGFSWLYASTINCSAVEQQHNVYSAVCIFVLHAKQTFPFFLTLCNKRVASNGKLFDFVFVLMISTYTLMDLNVFDCDNS